MWQPDTVAQLQVKQRVNTQVIHICVLFLGLSLIALYVFGTASGTTSCFFPHSFLFFLGTMVQLNLALQEALDDGFRPAELLLILQLWSSPRVMQRMRLLELVLGGKVRFMWLQHRTRKMQLCHVWIDTSGSAPWDYKQAQMFAAILEAALMQQGEEPVIRLLQPQLPQGVGDNGGDIWQACYEMGVMRPKGILTTAMFWQRTGWDSSVRFQENQRFVVVGDSSAKPEDVTLMAAFLAAGAALWDPSMPGWNWSNEQLLVKAKTEVVPPLRTKADEADAAAVTGLLRLLRGSRPALGV